MSPGRAPPLRRSRSGWAAPITASPYFGSGSRIVWPPARVPPASRTLAAAPSKTAASVSRGRSSGNAAIDRAKRTRPPIANTSLSAFAAAISPNVRASSTSGGKKSSVPMIASSSLTRYAAASSARLEAGDQLVGSGPAAPSPRERVRQEVGPELRRAAAAVGELGQADRGGQLRSIGHRHPGMIGPACGGAGEGPQHGSSSAPPILTTRPAETHRPTPRWRTEARLRSSFQHDSRWFYHRPWEWLGPGGFPGLQHRWRGAWRGVVGSTPMRSRQHLPRRVELSSQPEARPRRRASSA